MQENANTGGEIQNSDLETPIVTQETLQPTQETQLPQSETEKKTEIAISLKSEKLQTEKSEWQKRYTYPVNFSGKRGEIIRNVIQKGIDQGYWPSASHFWNKVADFAINSQLANKALGITKGFQFGIPDDAETIVFENGYYCQLSPLKNLQVCK